MVAEVDKGALGMTLMSFSLLVDQSIFFFKKEFSKVSNQVFFFLETRQQRKCWSASAVSGPRPPANLASITAPKH